MVENAFLSAKEMAQELVRQRVEPDEVANLLSYLRDNSEAGGEAFMAHLAETNAEGKPVCSEAMRQAGETYLRGLVSDLDSMKDILGWGTGFMRYYRGEGNRPEPNRRPSQPRPHSRPPAPEAEAAPRRPREVVEVTSPMDSLQIGQMLQGTVKRVMPYGVFVAVGSERDGLVHVSELRDGFVGDPSQVVNVNDTVEVWVKSIDMEQKRISLTMKGAAAAMSRQLPRQEDRQPYPQQEERRQPSYRQEGQRPSRRNERDGDSGSRSSGSSNRSSIGSSSQRGDSQRGDSGPRRRSSSGPRRPSAGARLYEDEMPKEATALAEALRRAMAESEEAAPAEQVTAEQAMSAGRSRQTEELAEAHRRTLNS